MSGMPTGPYQAWAQQALGFEYHDIQLLVTALTHRSYVNEHKKSVTEHNERLAGQHREQCRLGRRARLWLAHPDEQG